MLLDSSSKRVTPSGSNKARGTSIAYIVLQGLIGVTISEAKIVC